MKTNIIIYWIICLVSICITQHIYLNFDKYIQKNGRKFTYVSLILLCFIICLGPLQQIFMAVEDSFLLDVTIEEETKTNMILPDGCYYLGCEIISIEGPTEDEDPVYIYSFGIIDNTERNDIYQYESYNLLTEDVPYLLVMDSMGTNDVTDDEIIVVWACVY